MTTTYNAGMFTLKRDLLYLSASSRIFTRDYLSFALPDLDSFSKEQQVIKRDFSGTLLE